MCENKIPKRAWVRSLIANFQTRDEFQSLPNFINQHGNRNPRSPDELLETKDDDGHIQLFDEIQIDDAKLLALAKSIMVPQYYPTKPYISNE